MKPSSPAVPPVAHRIESTDQVSVVAHDYGGPTQGDPESAATVLLAHATGFHGRYWDPIATMLARSFRVVSVDLRGHGDSVVPEGVTMDWVGMAHDLLAVIDALQLRTTAPLFGVGHSMGGCSTLLAEHLRPGTFDRAWLMEPIVFVSDDIPDPTKNVMVDAARKRREVFPSHEAVLERYLSRPPFAGCDPEAVWAYVHHGFEALEDGSVRLKCRGEVEAQVFLHSVTDMGHHLDKVTLPILVAGSTDGQRPAEIAPIVADRLANGSFHLFEDRTHFAPMEDPVGVAQHIIEFFAQHGVFEQH